jgi:uncharacterized SAM-binding protein YcdF (DUF218 family)
MERTIAIVLIQNNLPVQTVQHLPVMPKKMGVRVALAWRFVAVTLIAAGLCGWLGRAFLLRAAAHLWMVSDPLTHADAIVVLGGNYRMRPREAAALYRKGLANKVLVSRPGSLYQLATGNGSSDYEVNRTELLNLGVPASAIEAFGTANANTREEAVALREWAKRNGASVFIIPAEIFTARRIKWIFRRELSGKPSIEVAPFAPPEYTRDDWWKTEIGSAKFQDEILKYIYYRWKY